MITLKRKQKKKEAKEVSEASTFSLVSLKKISKRFALLLFILFFSTSGTFTGGSSVNSSAANCELMQQLTDEEIYVMSVKKRIHDQLVIQVRDYIKRMAPTSLLNAEVLVTVCEKYDLDITFVMAQALLESHFGTRGKAAKTNSVWNVGTYDNGTILYKYETPNESIEPYAKLLYDNYLLLSDSTRNSKNLLHLLQDKGFVNYNGYRFASAKGYENALRKLMIKIDMETSISMLSGISQLSDDELISYFKPINHDELNYAHLHTFKN